MGAIKRERAMAEPRKNFKLRSNFEPGSFREAVRRAQWKALGISDEDMQKPKIAVVNTSSELAICFAHLDGVAKVVKDAVRAAGGLPFEIRTAAPSRFHHRPRRPGRRRRLHPAEPRSHRERHRDRGRRRAARRHGVPVVVRQDTARAPDGGGPLQHSDHSGRVRLSAARARSTASTSTSRKCSSARCRPGSAS